MIPQCEECGTEWIKDNKYCFIENYETISKTGKCIACQK